MEMDEKKIADSLSARFRLGLKDCVLSTKEGVLRGFRPNDISPPNGFMISLTTGWRSIEADFVPDNYAGDLIRAMGNSLPNTGEAFLSLSQVFESGGNHIKVRINGSVVSEKSNLPPAPWNKFELNVRRLTDAADESEEALQHIAEETAAACLALVLTFLPLEEDDTVDIPLYESGLPEGSVVRVTVNRYERNPANRAACIAAHGSICKICGFDFGKVYGPFAHGYIEVHHRIPVSQMGIGYIVNPVRDLVPLCSNCHAAVHRKDPPVEPEALVTILVKSNN